MDSSTSASRLEKVEVSGKYCNTMAAVLTRRQKWSIKVLTALVLMACYHNSLRVHSYLLRAASVPPFLSSWLKLYDEGDSSSFLHVTGLTREAFDSLLYVVIPPSHTMRWRCAGGGRGRFRRMGCWGFYFLSG